MKNLLFKLRASSYKHLLFLPGFLLLILPLIRLDSLPLFFSFLGRLHPLVIHFPIVLSVVILLVELARQFLGLKIDNRLMVVGIALTSISTLVSIGAGYFLFLSGDYSGNLPEQHLWAACITGTLIFSVTAFMALYRTQVFFDRVYISGLILTNVSILYASHLGGSITHGKDYLTEHWLLMGSAGTSLETRKEEDMLVYDDLLVPILENKCVSCHNALKAKGGLKMNGYENPFKPGDSGTPPLTRKDLDKSEIYKRIVLPEDHKDHMPPVGRAPLSKNEIELLKQWINSGATREFKITQLSGELNSQIQQLKAEVAKYQRKAEVSFLKRKKVKDELDQVAAKLGVVIQPDSAEDINLFTLAMKFPALGFGNEQIKSLRPYYEHFSQVSVASSQIDEEALYYLAQMTNLKKLYLQKTRIDGTGLVFFQKHKNLEVLNLSYTFVDDKAALDLLNIPNVKKVYLLKTRTSKEVLEALRQYRPELELLVEEGPYN